MSESTKVSKFKLFLIENGVKQRDLSIKSGLGVTTLHHLINSGDGSPKTIKKIVETLTKNFGLKITEQEISNMLK